MSAWRMRMKTRHASYWTGTRWKPARLPSFSYVITQQMIDEFRQGVMDPEAAFPTIAHKVDVQPYHMAIATMVR